MDKDFKETIRLNFIQRQILTKNHGSLAVAVAHVKAIDELIPLAWARAQKVNLEGIEIAPWQKRGFILSKSGIKDNCDFSPDKGTLAFHREMTVLKRENGLMS